MERGLTPRTPWRTWRPFFRLPILSIIKLQKLKFLVQLIGIWFINSVTISTEEKKWLTLSYFHVKILYFYVVIKYSVKVCYSFWRLKYVSAWGRASYVTWKTTGARHGGGGGGWMNPPPLPLFYVEIRENLNSLREGRCTIKMSIRSPLIMYLSVGLNQQ